MGKIRKEGCMSKSRILITGGSGFLGTALIERIKDQDIVVVGRNEGELVKLKEKFPNVEIIVGDIANRHVCKRACKDVTGIYHLAAMKHIGLAEQNPKTCIRTNIRGTINILDACTPDFFVFISTDKAAQVRGVYGATKFLIERLLKEYEQINPKTKYRVVRYGNVLYSTGSVLCKWKDKLIKGEDITVTDLDSTRFYWTVDEAIDLIFETLEKAKDCTPYMPIMKSIKMYDLVEAMMDKYGHSHMNIIGLQPGENKHETVDGIHFSDVAEQYTKDELMEMI